MRCALALGVSLAALLSACGGERDAEVAQERRNLILISLDTLRADRLGSYGYERPTSPALDALAAGGVRFADVIAEASWTLPSHVTLFTGLSPALHGVRQPQHRIPDDAPLLAEALRGAGFRTFGITGLGFLDSRFGFGRGFESYAKQPLSLAEGLGLTLRVLRGLEDDERFFAFVHGYEVHCPYEPPSPYAEAFQDEPFASRIDTAGRCGEPHFNDMELTPGQARYLSNRYDASIRYVDDLLAVFLQRLEADGLLASTIVCVLSDHGEEFLEHGRIGHRDTLYLESLWVPWILSGPGLGPRVVGEPAGLADVMPTLLELLGVEAPPTEGRSLVPWITGERVSGPERPRYSENDWWRPLRSVVAGDYHLVSGPGADAAGDGGRRLFDRRDDPREQSDLAASESGTLRALEARLGEREAELAGRRKLEPGLAAPVQPEESERLRALGYVE